MRIRNSLRGSTSHLVGGEQEDTNLFDYALRHNADSWDQEDHEFEELDRNHNSLICYISKHEDQIDVNALLRVLDQVQSQRED